MRRLKIILGWALAATLFLMASLCASNTLFTGVPSARMSFGLSCGLFGTLWTLAMVRVQRAGSYVDAARKLGIAEPLPSAAVILLTFEGWSVAVLRTAYEYSRRTPAAAPGIADGMAIACASLFLIGAGLLAVWIGVTMYVRRVARGLAVALVLVAWLGALSVAQVWMSLVRRATIGASAGATATAAPRSGSFGAMVGR